MTTDEKRATAEARRTQNVLAWLAVIEESARDLELELLSRRSETASETGTDPEPDKVLCRHPAVNRRGRLCLSCMNTGFVLDDNGAAADVDGLKLDPYLIDPPRDTYAVVRDQSDSARRARDLAQLDSAIESLERAARQREGLDVEEGEARILRVIGAVWHALGRDGRKVLTALLRLRETSPTAYRRVLARDDAAVALLAATVRGRLRAPA
jgi:hypothetical protein